jgi:RimJ/RimL family protein N-acetyltransferase
MIDIERLTNSHIASVKCIGLTNAQVEFACSSEEFLMDGSNTTHLHVIKSNDVVVGFFKLDIAYSLNYSFCPEGSIGLRTFALDKNQQGRGIGTDAVKALFSYLKTNYLNYKSIYLTVNVKNPRAIVCYQKAGFEKIDEKYFGGAAGPQHIM